MWKKCNPHTLPVGTWSGAAPQEWKTAWCGIQDWKQCSQDPRAPVHCPQDSRTTQTPVHCWTSSIPSVRLWDPLQPQCSAIALIYFFLYSPCWALGVSVQSRDLWPSVLEKFLRTNLITVPFQFSFFPPLSSNPDVGSPDLIHQLWYTLSVLRLRLSLIINIKS